MFCCFDFSALIRFFAKVLIVTDVNISNELNFSDVYRSVNYIGSLAKFTWGSFTLHATQYASINLRKNEIHSLKPGRVAQSPGHLTRKSGVLGSIPGLATYFRFSFRFFKKGSCQLLAKVCARSTG